MLVEEVTLDMPAPIPDQDSEGYWAAAERGILTGQRCLDCGLVVFPPFACCRRCSSMRFEWSPVPQQGVIYTWTTIYRSPRPEFAKHVPYTVAVIDVEGVYGRYPGILVDCPPLGARIGDKVTVGFEKIQGGFTLPVWRIATTS